MNGLTALVGSASTLHAITEPPPRTEFNSEEEYIAAYERWLAKITYWRSSVRVDPKDDDNPGIARPGQWETSS